jgi:hypothetical protein
MSPPEAESKVSILVRADEQARLQIDKIVVDSQHSLARVRVSRGSIEKIVEM